MDDMITRGSGLIIYNDEDDMKETVYDVRLISEFLRKKNIKYNIVFASQQDNPLTNIKEDTTFIYYSGHEIYIRPNGWQEVISYLKKMKTGIVILDCCDCNNIYYPYDNINLITPSFNHNKGMIDSNGSLFTRELIPLLSQNILDNRKINKKISKNIKQYL